MRSLPSWERGLKLFHWNRKGKRGKKVAPFVGAWIEMDVKAGRVKTDAGVAPFVGAWIEIVRAKLYY